MPAPTCDSARPGRFGASCFRRLSRRAAGVLCALLTTSGAFELHNLANHHRANAAGSLFDTAASHPRIPHHFDHSAEQHEPACATCALQAQARGVPSGSFRAGAPDAVRPFDSPPPQLAFTAALRTSESPRGPPAA